ncbi:hypothetical protein [Pseudomonas sp. FSL W5-0299]|uniref:hypothetical protein n=1 Tax=Pseudomonas sp. FSL W5-0299 TaxID=1917484 RepID=UPI00098A8727|nr:hypothetical protein [Pseudomonas sp. FSL W5-0299]OOL39128.1 hypothetical protein BOO94_04115 [Pseudomonas sp. FSL W5-0299]
MLLAKSCDTRNNIKNGTIKLGTLYEYRETEIEEIADREEGMLTFHLKFTGQVKVPAIWFNTLAGGSMVFGKETFTRFPGVLRAHFDTVNIVVFDGQDVVLRDSRATICRESPNSFVFCMSLVRKMRDSEGIFAGYDDCWYMTAAKAQRFGLVLGQVLLQFVKAEHLKGNFIVPKETDVTKLKVFVEHRSVDYISREIEIFDDAHTPLDVFMNKMQSMAFIKPDSYSPELEYRFNYTMVVDGKIVQPQVKKVILKSEQLLDLVV